jgi:hypothetical protein
MMSSCLSVEKQQRLPHPSPRDSRADDWIGEIAKEIQDRIGQHAAKCWCATDVGSLILETIVDKTNSTKSMNSAEMKPLVAQVYRVAREIIPANNRSF